MTQKNNLLEDQTIKDIEKLTYVPVHKRLEFWLILIGVVLFIVGFIGQYL